MQKMSKQGLSLLLAILMLCSGMTVAFAREPVEPDVQTTSSFGKGNALNAIVSGFSADVDDARYSVVKVEIGEDTADVTLNCAGRCTLIVAIYTESGGEMLDCAVQTVEANETSATVSLADIELPEYYTVKAFLLDENNCALCKNYESREHTQAYKEYLEKDPEDFAGEEVLIFDDEKDQEDFALLTDDVQTATDTGIMTFSYDESTLTFTFNNATQQVKALKVGDMFYWEYGDDGAYLLFKVRSIAVSGSTVEIVEDEDVSLEELFDYVRIDEDADFSNFKLTDENMGEAMELVPSVSAQAEIDESDKTSWSTEFKLTYPKKKEDDDPTPVGGKLTGTGKLFLTTSVKLYYDVVLFGKDYYEFEHTLEIGIDVTITASVALDFTPYLTLKAIPDIPIGSTGITIKIEPAVVLKVTASFSVTGKLTYKVTTTADRDNGLQKAQDVTFKPSADAQAKIEVQIGIQITFKVSWIKTISLEISGGGGAKIPMQVQLVGALLDKYHDCIFCLDGEIDFYVEISGKLKLSPLKLFDKEWTIVKFEKTWKWKDFYISVSGDGVHCGIGEHCNRIYHKVTVMVKDSAGKAAKDAAVRCTTAKILTNGKLTAGNTLTDKDGKAELYCQKGTHSVTVAASGYAAKTVSVNVLEIEKTITVTLGVDDPDDPTPGSDDDPDGAQYGELSQYSVGDTLTFGSYPQSRITDSPTLKVLNNINKTWKSYRYFSGTGSFDDGQMTASDYMEYCDVKMGDWYRGVRFTAYRYRPYCTGYPASASTSNTFQYGNGYNLNTVYWFKYEPLEWQVLDPYSGLVVCKTIIDSQPFNSFILASGSEPNGNTVYWGNADKTYYACDYENSSIRQWLKTDFYNTAFTTEQKKHMAPSILNNEGYYSLTGNTSYKYLDSPSTKDKVFLLSYDEVINQNYGFPTGTGTSAIRQAKGTDYAKCQGLGVFSPNECSHWWLRSAGYSSSGACSVSTEGWANSTHYNVYSTYFGVRPALRLNLDPGISKSPKKAAVQIAEQTEGIQTVQKGQTYTATQSGAVAGREYVLLVREAGATDVAAETLWYIDQQTATGSDLSFTYVPRGSGDCTVGIFGDFSLPAEYTVKWVVDGQTTTYAVAVGADIVKPADPVKEGYTFTDWSPAVPATMPSEDLTFTAVFVKNPDPVIRIRNYTAAKTIDYRSSITFGVDEVQTPVSGAQVQWFIDGKYVSSGNEYTKKEAKATFTIQAKYMKGNTVLAESEVETVKVKTDLWSRIVAFIRWLFGRLPTVVQAYLGVEIRDSARP